MHLDTNYHSFTNNNQVTAIESVSSAGIVPWLERHHIR